MVDAEHWIADGTFKSAPNLFTQLFTVHGLFPDGWHLPLFYGLLPGKMTTLYKNLFEELRTRDLGTLPAAVNPPRLRASYPQRSSRSLSLIHTTWLQLPLQEVPPETPPPVQPRRGVQCHRLPCILHLNVSFNVLKTKYKLQIH